MKVKLGLQTIPDNQLGSFTKSICNALTGNANVPTPNPTVAALSTLMIDFTTALDNYDAARASLKELVTLKDNARAALETGLTTEASTVESQTGGSQAGIESAGMDVQATPTHTTSLGPVEGFGVTTSDYPGALDWHCDRDHDAKFYVPQTTPAPVTAASVWTTQEGASASSGTVVGLPSGVATAMRLVKQGPHHLVSPPSDPITRIVP